MSIYANGRAEHIWIHFRIWWIVFFFPPPEANDAMKSQVNSKFWTCFWCFYTNNWNANCKSFVLASFDDFSWENGDFPLHRLTRLSDTFFPAEAIWILWNRNIYCIEYLLFVGFEGVRLSVYGSYAPALCIDILQGYFVSS